MSSNPLDEDDPDVSDEFLRDVARVEDRAPPSTTRLEGTNIGRFKVVSEIGRGGMGVVFLAEDEKLRRKVALKLLPPSFAADELRRRRFVREARAAAAVSHPNLVTVYDVGEHEGRAYIAMEYLRGRSLRDLLGDRPLSIDEAVELARQVLAGLSHAHAAGLLHRDLKPENVLVDADGRVRLVDFGLAKLDGDIDGPADNTTRDGLVMGTPGYMSPEQARGQGVDARADIFSFGVLFYELVTRKRPFTGPTRADVVTALLRDTPPRAEEARPEVGGPLSDVIERCLAKAPEDRYPTAHALLDGLEDAWSETKKRRESAPVAAASQAPSAKRASPRSRPLAFAAAATLALGALGLGLATVKRAPKGASAPASTDASAAKPIAITDVPLPTSRSPEALASYRQALQAIRDADWAIAGERFAEATRLDPELSAAYLRLAIIEGSGDGGASKARELLSRAMTTRPNLSERDQALLFAVEPLINRDPAERTLAGQRLEELVQSRPEDAELWHLFAVFGARGKEEAIEAARRAVALDPQFADAWQILAQQLGMQGKVPEALAAIDRCVAISPLSADCRGERARLHGVLGECTLMEEDLRRGLSSNPRAATIWHEDRAAALVAVGRADDTVLEAFRQKWALLGEEKRKGVEPFDRARLAAARGRFGEAEALLVEGEKAIEREANTQTHARYAGLRIAIAKELARPKDAAKIAETFVAKKDVWIGSSAAMDTEVPMLRVMQQGGRLSAEDFARRSSAWFSRARDKSVGLAPMHLWSLAYANSIETREEARVALAALPAYDGSELGFMHVKEGFARAELGHALLLDDRAGEALPHLQAATTACNWLHWPVQHTRTVLHLGQAQERLGNQQAACDAYHRVVARWGTAKRSVTRDAARARLSALRCSSQGRSSTSTAPPVALPAPPEGPGAPPVPPPPPLPPDGASPEDHETRTLTRTAVGRNPERGAACAMAKEGAIEKASCLRHHKSADGDCNCTRARDGWACSATLAVTCN